MNEEQQQKAEELQTALRRALNVFVFDHDDGQMRHALQNSLATILEAETRRLVQAGLFVERGENSGIKVSLSKPLGDFIAVLYGCDVFEHVFEDYVVSLPGWKKPDNTEQTPSIDANPTYVDPRTHRPTHGRLGG